MVGKVNSFEKQLNSGFMAGLEIGEGQLTIFQHGVPEVPYFLIPLVSRFEGRRFMLPWLPGLADSKLNSKFTLEGSVQLLVEFIESQNVPVDFIGLDWGGGLGWLLEARRQRAPVKNLRKVVVVACPYLPKGAELLKNDEEQKKSASYMSYFMRPDFPDKVRSHKFVPLKAGLPLEFVEANPELLDVALAAWNRNDYLVPMQMYYKQLLSASEEWLGEFDGFTPSQEFTWIWGAADEFFVRANAEGDLPVDPLVVEGATHFEHLKSQSKLCPILTSVLAK